MKIQLPLILLLNIIGIILFLSWLLPENHGFWFPIDSAIFYFFNNNLAKYRLYLWLVALSNSRSFDSYALIMIGLIIFLYYRRINNSDKKKIILVGLTLLLTEITLHQLSQILIPVRRSSPTLFFSDTYRAKDLLNISTKDTSKNSFPGDHGTTLFVFSAFMLRYFGKRAFVVSLFIVVFFSLPRIMIGAHWFTDIIVGSLSVVLIGLPWCLMTPLNDNIIIFFNRRLFNKIQNSKK